MRLELEITHRCNKNCRLCDHRIATSDYDYLTIEQYWQILDAARPLWGPDRGSNVDIRQPGDFDGVLLIGGEPLMHPHFVDLADMSENYSICWSGSSKSIPAGMMVSWRTFRTCPTLQCVLTARSGIPMTTPDWTRRQRGGWPNTASARCAW